MAKVELYIEGELCDISGKESINVDYTNFDVSKIDSRGGARSYSFNLPKTNRNKSVFENPEMINNLSMVPYTRMECRLFIDGVDMLIRFCEVQSVKDSYSVQLYGANSDMFNDLRDKRLQDLDFSEYDHFWDFETVKDGLYNTEGFGYGIIDYHSDSPNTYITDTTIHADFLLPFVYVNKILEKIFNALDYTVTNDIESDTINMVVPQIWQALRNKDARRYEAQFSLNMIPINGSSGLSILGTPPYGDTKMIFNILDSQHGKFFLTGTNLVDTNHYFGDGFTMDVTFDLIVENNTSSPTDVTFKSNFSQLDNPLVPVEFTFNTLPGLNYIYHTINISLSPVTGYSPSLAFLNFTAHAGAGVIAFEVILKNGSKVTFDNVVITKPYNVTYEQSIYYDRFNYMTVSSALPDMTQIEFLKNYMQMFCLLPIVNDINKTIRLIKFDSIATNTINAYDWSNKIDLTEYPEIKFIQNEYGQHNKFIYKDDGEEQKPQGTDGEITIDNDNLELEKTQVELSYAGTKANIRLTDDLISQIGVFKDGEYDAQKVYRILNLRRGLNGSDTLIDSYGGTYALSGAVNVPYFIDALQTFNLGFGDNLITNYYRLLSDILSKVKVVRQYVRLSAAEMSMLDFSRPVWIAKYESYFYISSVKGFTYTESKSTLVELVKLNING